MSRCDAAADSAVDHVLNLWTISLGQSDVSDPVGQLTAKQREWDKPHIDADLARLMASLTDGHHQARLLAVSTPHSGDCPFHLAVFVWTTRPSESPSVYASVPNTASLMRRQRQPRRHARSHLQTQCRQNNPSPCTQRPRLACTRPCQYNIPAVKERA